MWEVSSGSESIRLLARQPENSTSKWESFWERSRLGSWLLAFRDCPGMVPENVCICGFKKNSSNLDRAPTTRASVLLKSWDSFLVTLPSISSKNCALYCSVIPGADEFCDWLFRGFSCVSLDIAANLRLFLIVAIFGKRLNSGEDWNSLYFLKAILSSTKDLISISLRNNRFQSATVNWVEQNYSIKLVQWYTKIITKIVFSFLLYIPSAWRET